MALRVVAAPQRSRRELLAAAAGAAALAIVALLTSASAVVACTPEQVQPVSLADIERRVALVVDGTVTETALDEETWTVRLEIRIIRILKGSAAGAATIVHDGPGNCPFGAEVGARVIVAAAEDGTVMNGWVRGAGGSAFSHYRTVPEVATWSAVSALFSAPDTALAELTPRQAGRSVSDFVLLLGAGLTTFVLVLHRGSPRRRGRRRGAIAAR